MCLQNISILVSKIRLFGHYLEIASLDFADFAHYIRQEWYLTGLGGSSPQKKYLRLLWTIKTCLQIIFLSPNSISWLLLISFFCFAYFDRQQWFLAGTGGFSRQKIFEVQIEPIFDMCPNYFCLQIHYLDFYLQAFFFILHSMIENNDF